MGAVLQFAANLEEFTCWAREGCGITFAIPYQLAKVCREQGVSFYCPKGHHLSLGESDVTKLKRQLEQKQRDVEFQRNWRLETEKRADRAEHQARALKGVVTKVKKRVGHGVCPCCNRTFAQLAKHMSAKHPEFAGEEATHP